ncbi:MAG: hypothetical protein Q9M91_03500 [Candidatus Dojkabacteria bacterium]|nr:hypothetical protein [Candidatus Dojkabacteria bacterium]
MGTLAIAIVSYLTILWIVLGGYHIYSLLFSTPFYPSRVKHLKEAFQKLGLEVTKSTNFVDLGSGDGRVVVWAARMGMKSTGIELNPFLTFY